MEFISSAYLTGLALGLLVSLDAVLITTLSHLMGIKVDGTQVFFGGKLRRRIGRSVWQVGWMPLGSGVKLPGLAREEGEEVKPEDFDQQPLGKRIFLLLADKIFLTIVLLINLIFIPATSLGDAFTMITDLFVYIFTLGDGPIPPFPSGYGPFIVGFVTTWLLIGAILPIGGNKTQILLTDLMGLSTKIKMRIMTTVTFLGMVFAGYMIYCLIRYVNIAFPGEVLSIWVSAILGG